MKTVKLFKDLAEEYARTTSNNRMENTYPATVSKITHKLINYSISNNIPHKSGH